MKKLLTIILSALALGASAQQFTVTTTTNGILTNSVNGRSTNFFQTNMSKLMAAWTNDLATLNWQRNNQPSTNSFITNAPSIQATNLDVVGSAKLTNAILNNSRATNLVGTFIDPFIRAVSTGLQVTNESNDAGLAMHAASGGLTPQIYWAFDGVIAWDIAANTNEFSILNDVTGLNFISTSRSLASLYLGDASGVNIYPLAPIANAAMTNSSFHGTNHMDGEFAHISRSYTAAGNGYNSGISLGTNAFVQISGPSAAWTNSSFKGGYAGLRVLVQAANPANSMTLLHQSSIGAPASTEKINTTTGALLNITNNPAFFELIHNGTEWNVLYPVTR